MRWRPRSASRTRAIYERTKTLDAIRPFAAHQRTCKHLEATTNAVRNKGENMRLSPVHRVSGALLVLALLAIVPPAHASSHREALAILNEPCADNTDTFAWVSPGTHDKLYLVMDFYPLHEPGQGNQGLRACNGYRYEFHIAKGKSLKDKLVYRVEFTNQLPLSPPPNANSPVGGGNEL